jgi:hypothetical protein
MKKFGKLEKVELRDIWPGGVTEFTYWLSQEENIQDLGKVSGMDLRVVEQDRRTDLFKEYILCRDTLTDNNVLIYNQLDLTDHYHLGQLLSCSSGLEAVNIIWIVKTFNKEHLAALNWLNRVTDESIKFYGIEIEIYKIADSLPAISYNILVKPDNLAFKAGKSASPQKLSETDLLQLEYWHGLKNFMEENNSFVSLLGTPPKSWFDTSIDKGKYFLSVVLIPQDNSLNISLNIIGEDAKDDFEKLSRIAYNDSLAEISKDLKWYKIHAKGGCTITLKSYADFMEKNDWLNQFAWFKENLEKFDKFFKPKIKQLFY